MKKCGVIIGLRPTDRSMPFLTEVMILLRRMQFSRVTISKSIRRSWLERAEIYRPTGDLILELNPIRRDRIAL